MDNRFKSKIKSIQTGSKKVALILPNKSLFISIDRETNDLTW